MKQRRQSSTDIDIEENKYDKNDNKQEILQ